MKRPNALIFDCEILKAIPPIGDSLKEGLQYAQGWEDYEGMGISCIAVYDYLEDAYRVFLEDNLSDFGKVAGEREHIIGFNSSAFDDPLCYAHGLAVETTYDLLSEVRRASGQPPHYVAGVTRRGYSLEALAWANLGIGKSGSGALAPELWQRGAYGRVISYCLRDVALTRRLFEMRHALKDPTDGSTLTLRNIEGFEVAVETAQDLPEGQWGLLELLGHRRLAGLVSEQTFAGVGVIRIDVPEGDSFKTQLYAPSALYGFTPTSEDVVRAYHRPPPMRRWELPGSTPDHDPYDYDVDESEADHESL